MGVPLKARRIGKAGNQARGPVPFGPKECGAGGGMDGPKEECLRRRSVPNAIERETPPTTSLPAASYLEIKFPAMDSVSCFGVLTGDICYYPVFHDAHITRR